MCFAWDIKESSVNSSNYYERVPGAAAEGAFSITLTWIPSPVALTSGVTFGNLHCFAKSQSLHVLVGEDVTHCIGLLRDN